MAPIFLETYHKAVYLFINQGFYLDPFPWRRGSGLLTWGPWQVVIVGACDSDAPVAPAPCELVALQVGSETPKEMLEKIGIQGWWLHEMLQ